MKSVLIFAAGFFNLAAALFHIGFWRIFRWPASLRGAGRVNASTIQVLNIVLIYVFVVFGTSLLWFGTEAPAILLVAGGCFYLLRLALQPLYYGLVHPASRAIGLLALLGAVLHLAPVFLN